MGGSAMRDHGKKRFILFFTGRLLLRGGVHFGAASISGRLLFRDGFYFGEASITSRLLFRGGLYFGAFPISGRLLFRGGFYSGRISIFRGMLLLRDGLLFRGGGRGAPLHFAQADGRERPAFGGSARKHRRLMGGWGALDGTLDVADEHHPSVRIVGQWPSVEARDSIAGCGGWEGG